MCAPGYVVCLIPQTYTRRNPSYDIWADQFPPLTMKSVPSLDLSYPDTTRKYTGRGVPADRSALGRKRLKVRLGTFSISANRNSSRQRFHSLWCDPEKLTFLDEWFVCWRIRSEASGWIFKLRSALTFALTFDPQLHIFCIMSRPEEVLESLFRIPFFGFVFLPSYSTSLELTLSWLEVLYQDHEKFEGVWALLWAELLHAESNRFLARFSSQTKMQLNKDLATYRSCQDSTMLAQEKYALHIYHEIHIGHYTYLITPSVTPSLIKHTNHMS